MPFTLCSLPIACYVYSQRVTSHQVRVKRQPDRSADWSVAGLRQPKRDEMAEFVVPLRKQIEDSLTRQALQNMRGFHRKGLAEREKKEQILVSNT